MASQVGFVCVETSVFYVPVCIIISLKLFHEFCR